LCGFKSSLWLNRTGTTKRKMRARALVRRKSNIRIRHSGTSGFSRLWRCRAARSRRPTLCACTNGAAHSFQPSMPYTLEAREICKLGLAAEMLRDCGKVQLRAWGTSMLPSVWPGDLLTIQSVAQDEVVPGDIVLVLRDHRFFVHRLVEMRQDQGGISW